MTANHTPATFIEHKFDCCHDHVVSKRLWQVTVLVLHVHRMNSYGEVLQQSAVQMRAPDASVTPSRQSQSWPSFGASVPNSMLCRWSMECACTSDSACYTSDMVDYSDIYTRLAARAMDQGANSQPVAEYGSNESSHLGEQAPIIRVCKTNTRFGVPRHCRCSTDVGQL